jgi:polysaccharide biosynthesis transport protein
MNNAVAITVNTAGQRVQEIFRQSWMFSNFYNRKTGAFASVAFAAVAGSHLVPTEHYSTQYEGKLQLSLESKEEDTSLSNPSRLNLDAAQVNIAAPSVDYETQARVLWSPKLLSPVIAQLQEQYPTLTYAHLSHNLKITHPEGSNTLEISYQDKDAQRAQAVLEQLTQAYLKYSQESPTHDYSALQFLEKRVPQLQQKVALTQETIQQLQQQQGSTNLAQLGQQLSEQSNLLAQQQQALQSQLIEARTAYAVLQHRAAESFEHLSQNQLFVNQLPAYQLPENQLLNQQDLNYQELLNQFQATAIQLATEYSHPKDTQASDRAKRSLEQQYQQLSEQLSQTAQQPLIDRLSQLNKDSESANSQEVNRLETLIELKVAENQVRMLEISDGAIAQTQTLLDGRIKQWASLARQYDALQLELQLATSKLNLSLVKQAELQTFIQFAWQVIAPPHVKPIAEGFALSDAQRDFGLSLVLCFIVVVWAMAAWKDVDWKDANWKNQGRSPRSFSIPLPCLQPDFQQPPQHQSFKSQPLALQMPKVLCSIEEDYSSLPAWGDGLFSKTSGNARKLALRNTAS